MPTFVQKTKTKKNRTVLPRDYAKEQETLVAAKTESAADHPLLPPKPKEIPVMISEYAKFFFFWPLHDCLSVLCLQSTPVTSMAKPVAIYDPLSASDPLSATSAASDPLSAAVFDPLSSHLQEVCVLLSFHCYKKTHGRQQANKASGKHEEEEDDNGMSAFTPWAAKKNGILSKYCQVFTEEN